MVTNWQQNQGRLRDLLKRPRFGLISDFDGTLSAFARRPTDAVILPENAPLLDALAGQIAVLALISGRAAHDLRGRFPRPDFVYYGNHGMEYWQDGEAQFVEAAQPWLEPLSRLVAHVKPRIAFEGVILEDKRVTASVHYRLAADPLAMRERLYAELAPACAQYGFHLSEGQLIWEIKPPIEVDKGTAACAIVEAYQLDAVLFMGDDVTDYHAMDRLRHLVHTSARGFVALSVGVVHATTPPELFTHCDLTAEGVHDVAALLDWLLAECQRKT